MMTWSSSVSRVFVATALLLATVLLPDFRDSADAGMASATVNAEANAEAVPVSGEDLAEKLVVAFLDRQPTPDESIYVSEYVAANGVGPLVQSISRSFEWLTVLVDGLYLTLLDRIADDDGLEFWVNQLAGDTSTAEVAALIIGSDEFRTVAGGSDQAIVERMYLRLLGRPADPEGLDYWLQEVAVHGPAVVGASMYGSLENRRVRVDALYRLLLCRPPDAEGLNYWAERISGGRDLELSMSLADSLEFRTAQGSCSRGAVVPFVRKVEAPESALVATSRSADLVVSRQYSNGAAVATNLRTGEQRLVGSGSWAVSRNAARTIDWDGATLTLYDLQLGTAQVLTPDWPTTTTEVDFVVADTGVIFRTYGGAPDGFRIERYDPATGVYTEVYHTASSGTRPAVTGISTDGTTASLVLDDEPIPVHWYRDGILRPVASLASFSRPAGTLLPISADGSQVATRSLSGFAARRTYSIVDLATDTVVRSGDFSHTNQIAERVSGDLQRFATALGANWLTLSTRNLEGQQFGRSVIFKNYEYPEFILTEDGSAVLFYQASGLYSPSAVRRVLIGTEVWPTIEAFGTAIP